ncbi:exopolysaccharide biosynthesis polyprenyl glycosylphosphotransferase [Streptomyces sp. DW26H14]|uniref:exopolysaccharide biosynthesis polyprenyl glycosylphosphotransferase n=1 Tax=Streptomyces sp. DW26H14 TaxID=3435395 RepID=UPI00403E1E8A
MSTESTSVPSPSGPAHRAGATAGRVTIASPPRDHAWEHAPRGLGASGPLVQPSRRRPARTPVRRALSLVAADLAGVAAALAAVRAGDDVVRDVAGAVLAACVVACVTALNASAGLYDPPLNPSVLDRLPALAARVCVAWCVAAAGCQALFSAACAPATLAEGACVQLAVASACRAAVHARARAAAGTRARPALVVGTGARARAVAALLVQHPEYGLRPVGIADAAAGEHPADRAGADGGAALPVLTAAEDVHRAIVQSGVEEAVFVGADALTGHAGPAGAGFEGLLPLVRASGCGVVFVGDGGWEAAARPRMTDHLWGFAFRRLDAPGRRPWHGRRAKRLLDITVAAPALLALSPLLLGCALAVRLLDGPGVLFRQERVGQDGRLFTLLKFRTLRPLDDHESATRWNIAGDHRMSAVGGILRKTSMDELPQLWNVLRGDMSLVGPRPERPHFVANFSKTLPGYAARHRMPVGITGLAQVHGLRGDTSIEDRSRFDNHYIDHWSLWQDVCILVRTAVSLVRPAGS